MESNERLNDDFVQNDPDTQAPPTGPPEETTVVVLEEKPRFSKKSRTVIAIVAAVVCVALVCVGAFVFIDAGKTPPPAPTPPAPVQPAPPTPPPAPPPATYMPDLSGLSLDEAHERLPDNITVLWSYEYTTEHTSNKIMRQDIGAGRELFGGECLSVVIALNLDEPVEFSSLAVEQAIRRAYGTPDDSAILYENISGRITLTVVGFDKAIADDLNRFLSLRMLTIEYSPLSDLSFLKELTRIESLSLVGNRIADLSPLSELVALRSLRLSDNHITDLTPLSKLVKLEQLNLENNQVTDLSALSELTYLKRLYLRGNNVTDLSPLSQLSRLMELDLSNNSVADATPLHGLSRLTTLDLQGCMELSQQQIDALRAALPSCKILITDIPTDGIRFYSPAIEALVREQLNRPVGAIYQSDLDAITSLTVFEMTVDFYDGAPDNPYLVDIRDIALFRNLTVLKLDAQETLSDISPLAGLTKLTHLSLVCCSVSDISPLSSLTALKELHLSSNQIETLSPLSSLTELETLDLEGVPLSDISPLSSCAKLSHLSLSSTGISDISPLSALSELKMLSIGFCPVGDLSPLSGLSQLSELYAYAIPCMDFSALPASIKLLRTAGVWKTNEAVSTLAGLTNLEALTITFSYENVNVDLSALGNMTKLKDLVVGFPGGNNTNDELRLNITPLAGLHALEILQIAGPCKVDISPLSSLAKLKRLYIHAAADSLAPLSGLTGLELLDVNCKLISDLSPLGSLLGLRRLTLSNLSAAVNLTGLSPLNKLEALELGSSGIGDLSPLYSLSGLENIAIYECPNVTDAMLEELKRQLPSCAVNDEEFWGFFFM